MLQAINISVFTYIPIMRCIDLFAVFHSRHLLHIYIYIYTSSSVTLICAHLICTYRKKEKAAINTLLSSTLPGHHTAVRNVSDIISRAGNNFRIYMQTLMPNISTLDSCLIGYEGQ